MFNLNNFYVGDSVQWMKDNLPDNYIDLVISSPPYDQIRKYNGYDFDYQSMFMELHRVMKIGGVIVWVVGDQVIQNRGESGSSFTQALYAIRWFNLHDTMIFEKKSNPYSDKTRYCQKFEYMFVFSKGKPKTFNPIKDKPNKCAGQSPWGKKWGERQTDGSLKESGRHFVVGEFGKRGNIWTYDVGKGFMTKDKIAHNHPAIFPDKLAEDHIISWSNPGDIVLDPMCGSGTVCKMAYLNKRNFIGIDMSEEYISNICKPRLQSYGWEENLQGDNNNE